MFTSYSYWERNRLNEWYNFLYCNVSFSYTVVILRYQYMEIIIFELIDARNTGFGENIKFKIYIELIIIIVWIHQ